MIGLDCNILVQLAFADHAANSKTPAYVQSRRFRGLYRFGRVWEKV